MFRYKCLAGSALYVFMWKPAYEDVCNATGSYKVYQDKIEDIER
jgi:hypothetical protein